MNTFIDSDLHEDQSISMDCANPSKRAYPIFEHNRELAAHRKTVIWVKVFNYLLILAAIALIVLCATSCTKKQITPPNNATIVKQSIQQNDSLVGVYYKDSVASGQSDTLTITLAAFNDIGYNSLGVQQIYESKTWVTSCDSLFTTWNSLQWHYKYTISGNQLTLSSPVNLNGGIYVPTKYYYTKIK